MIFPEMAAASAALKLGSFVNEEAICSIKNWWKSGLSASCGSILAGAAAEAAMEDTLLFMPVMGDDGLGSVKSRVMVGPPELLRVVTAELPPPGEGAERLAAVEGVALAAAED